MPKPRGKEHTTLTETASLVVNELKAISGVKMVAPGMIRTTSMKGSGKRFITFVYTNAGCELIVSGQSVQKIAVHTDDPKLVFSKLRQAKKLKLFEFSERERKPYT